MITKEQVIDAMTTNETFWFRDGYPYDHFRDLLLPQLMGGNNKMFGPVRVWSAACSSAATDRSRVLRPDAGSPAVRRRGRGAYRASRPVRARCSK